MTLRDKKFERTLRRRLRTELRRSKALWREFRRGRSWFRRHFSLPFWMARLFFLGIGTQALTTFSYGNLDILISVILIYGVLSACILFSKLKIALHFSPRLAVFALMPISDAQVFSTQAKVFLRSTLWSILDFTILYGLLAERVGYGPGSVWVGLTLGIFQWLAMLGLAFGLVAFLPRRKVYSSVAIWLVAAGVMAAAAFSGRSLFSGLAKAAEWIPPLGWTLYAMGIKIVNTPAALFTTAVAGAMLAALPQAYRTLRRIYVMPVMLRGTEALTKLKRSATRPGAADQVELDSRTAVKASLQAWGIAAGFDWKKAGWLERKIAGWLRPEELLTAEFLCAANPRWTARLIKTGLIYLGIAVFVCLARQVFIGAPVLTLYTGAYLIGFFTKGWEGIASRDVSGSRMAVNTIYPLSFGQLARVMIKINLIRLVLISFFLIPAGALILYGMGARMEAGIYAFKGLFFLAFLQPVFPIFAVSSNTTDARSWRLVFLMSVLGTLFCAAALLYFLSSGFLMAAVAGLGLCVCAIVALLVYSYAYNHNWFEVQRKPDDRRTGSTAGA